MTPPAWHFARISKTKANICTIDSGSSREAILANRSSHPLTPSMSKAATSPTARLLQSSRLFSLPRPLPQPAYDGLTSTGMYRTSDTATQPYPTLQAIATPASSHSRGDWGLKRPLPGKTTRGSSTPYIRISAQDTVEHITDFGSAADHTQTAAKWRELGVPVLAKQGRSGAKAAAMSVFEEGADNTEGGLRKYASGREIQG